MIPKGLHTVWWGASLLLIAIFACSGESKTSPPTEERAVQSSETIAGRNDKGASNDTANHRHTENTMHPFHRDTAAQESLAAVQQEIQRTGGISALNFEAIKTLYERYPDAQPVIVTYDRALFARKDWDALIRLHSAKPLDQRSPSEQAFLASILIETKRFAEAADIVVPMAQADPKNPKLAWLAAQASFAQGDYARTAVVLDGAWDELLAAGEYDALFLRGLVHFHLGEFAAAAAKLKKLIEIYPNHAPANNALGRVLAATGQIQEAKIYLDRAAQVHKIINANEQQRARVTAQINAINEAWHNRRFDECERLIHECLGEVDDAAKAELYHLLSRIYQATGRMEQARNAMTQANRLRKNNDE